MSKNWKKPFALGVFALLVLAVVGFYFYKMPHPKPDNAVRLNATGVANAEIVDAGNNAQSLSITEPVEGNGPKLKTDSDGTDAEQPKAILPMPPLDVPVVDSINALLDLAESGDPEAACRVVLDFRACWADSAAKSMAGKYRVLARNASSDLERANYIQLAATYYDKSETNRAHCEGMSSYGRVNADFSDRIAAGMSNLSVRQKVLLTMTDSSGNLVRLPEDFMPDPRSEPLPIFLVYPQYLTDLDLASLDEGIRAADPLALEGKIILHMPIPGARNLGLRESLPDAFQFAKYSLMMAQLFGEKSLGGLASSVLANLGGAIPDDRRDLLQKEVDAGVEQWRAASTISMRKRLSKSVRTSRTECSTGGEGAD